MRIFLDTSVLVTACNADDPKRVICADLVQQHGPKRSFAGLHTLAECYATLTALPKRPRIQPEQALKFLEDLPKHLQFVALTQEEYFLAMERTMRAGITSGAVYDALLLECARKAKVQKIYTFNVRHFRAVAPDLADKIVEP